MAGEEDKMGLEEVWQKLSFTEMEEQVVDLEDKENTNERVFFMFKGRMFINKFFSVAVMKNTLRLIWKFQYGLAVREIESNMFIF